MKNKEEVDNHKVRQTSQQLQKVLKERKIRIEEPRTHL